MSKKATFPNKVRKGNFADVFGKRIGGDADDYVTGTFGIPSVTNELGDSDMYIDGYWIAKTKENAFQIVQDNSKWLQYMFLHLPEYSKQL